MSTHDPAGADGPGRPRILLVEDNAAASKGLSKILDAHGYDVTIVHTGAAALEAFDAGPAPDFVLTDLRLPDLDGREVARRARELVPPPRVALITGWDYDPSDAPSWGIEWFFSKPLDTKDLLAKLRTPRVPDGHD